MRRRSTLDAKSVEGLKRLAARSDEIVALVDIVGAGLARGPEIADNINGLVQIARDAAGPQRRTDRGTDGARSRGCAR